MLRKTTRPASSGDQSNRAVRLGIPSGFEPAFFDEEKACQNLI